MEVTNDGPDRATGVVLTDTLPVSATIVSITPSQGTCIEEDRVIVCHMGSLESTAEATLTVVVSADGFEDLENSVEVSAQERDLDLRDNSAVEYAVITAVEPRLYLPLALR